MTPTRLAILLPLCAALACDPKPAPTETPAAEPPPATGEESPIARSVRAAMNPEIDPCVDFYEYACGGWLENTTIPPDKATESRGFSAVADRNEKILRRILEDAAEAEDPQMARLGDFYQACMDTEAIDARGLEPLQPVLDRIEAIATPADLMRVTGELGIRGIEPFFSFAVWADMKDPETYLLSASQGGLGLPDRDFYLDEARQPVEDAYRGHVARMFEILGDSPEQAEANAETVLAIEMTLAEASLPREDLRKPELTYHKIDRAGLQEQTPHLPWDAWFEGAGYPDLTSINVETPTFFAAADQLAANRPIEDLKTYLRWWAIHDTVDALPTAVGEESFAFYGKVLSGQQEQRPRWKKCVGWTDGALGDLLGQAYVDEEFEGDSKAVAEEMIRRVEASLLEGLDDLDWMDPVTAERAQAKLEAIVNKIGYPDEWKTYDGLEVSADQHFENLMAARDWQARYWLDQVAGPVDEDEWYMSAPTVNAYYNPSANEIVFPAGILQPPFFDREFPRAMNYGAMGMVMGHEVTHGFDDEGRKFDPEGRLSDWWEPEAVARFEERAECVRDLYSGYEVLPEVTINGTLTAGENIADLGGIKHAFGAYRQWSEDHGAEEPVAGLTPEQLFFVGYAQSWCTLRTPEYEQMAVSVDPHSSPRFRVNGPVSQTQAFAEVFECAPGTPMNPEQVCVVW